MKKIIAKIKKANFLIPDILVVLVASLVVRLFLANFGTLQLDHNTFVGWSNILAERGLKSFYNGWSDYLPGYLYILWLLGKIHLAFPALPAVILYKLPAILVDIFTGFLIYRIVYRLKNPKWGLVSAALYIFNPAVLSNSTLWGQIDSFTALFSLLAVWLFGISSPLSAICLAVGTLIKPQTAFIAPLILFFALKEKWKIQKIVYCAFVALAVFVLAFVPFNNLGNIFAFIIQRLQATFGQYPYGSVNAFNFWGLFGFWRSDLITKYIGYGFVAICYLLTAFLALRKKISKYACASLIFLFTFLFLTRMHERHLLPVFAPLAIAAAESSLLFIPFVGLSITYLANLFYAFRWISFDFVEVFPPFINKLFIVLNLGLFAFFIVCLFKKNIKFKLPTIKSKEIISLPGVNLSSRSAKYLLAAVLVFAAVTRFFALGSPKNEYFDEVYHAFTAKLVIHSDPKAWEWWNTHPEGFAYEWTHPPLAKLGMALGMKILGENAWGWRVPGSLLGVVSVFWVYLIAKQIFKDELIGILSAAVFSLDGLVLVMNRIGMNDSYLLFFSLLSLYFFLRQKDLLSAVSFGLALSSKWSAIWLIPILFVLWLKTRPALSGGKIKFNPSLLWFIILPPLIYLASYWQMFATGHNFDIFWGMQKQMWWYHTGLHATHPYTSPWWSWPLLVRPIYLYTSEEIGGWVSRIYAMGNPVVFWFGLCSIVSGLYYSFVHRNKNLAFVIFCYFIFFVPWAVSPRIMFLYHYLPSVPFLAIVSGYVLRKFPKLIIGYSLFAIILFAYFYPHWAGLSIPLWLDRSYYWLSSWR